MRILITVSQSTGTEVIVIPARSKKLAPVVLRGMDRRMVIEELKVVLEAL